MILVTLTFADACVSFNMSLG